MSWRQVAVITWHVVALKHRGVGPVGGPVACSCGKVWSW